MKHLSRIFKALLGVAALILTTFIATGQLTWRTIRNWWTGAANRLRQIAMATFLLIIAGIGILIGRIYYVDNYGRDYYDQKLSDHIILRSFADNRWQVYNKLSEEYTTEKINWLVANEGDSLAVYALSDKRGYINTDTGKIVIDAKDNCYNKAWVFSEGVAAVMKEGKIGFINTKNEVVIPFQFDYTDKCRMYDFGYIFHNGHCAIPNKDGDLGLIDLSGKWIVEPEYDEIWSPNSHGYRIIIKDNNYGILDSAGTIKYPVEYSYISAISEGFVLAKNGHMWKVDFEDNIVQPFLFDDTSHLYYPTGYNDCDEIVYELSDYVQYEVTNRYGIMNRITGEVITPAIYSGINMLSKRVFRVQESNIYEWHLLDTEGNVIKR